MNNEQVAVLGFVVGLFFVVCTSIWAALDARANRIPTTNKPYSLNNGALMWFFGCLLLWIIYFPCYLYRRFRTLRERKRALAPPPTMNVRIVNAEQPGATPAHMHKSVLRPDIEQELRRLAKLVQDKLISESDFEMKKKQMLGI
jgi:hypothetical protein